MAIANSALEITNHLMSVIDITNALLKDHKTPTPIHI